MLKADIVSVSGGALGLVVPNLMPEELRDHPDNVFCKYFVCTGTDISNCPVGTASGDRPLRSWGVQIDPSSGPIWLCQFETVQGVILPANGTGKLNPDTTIFISKWSKHRV